MVLDENQFFLFETQRGPCAAKPVYVDASAVCLPFHIGGGQLIADSGDVELQFDDAGMAFFPRFWANRACPGPPDSAGWWYPWMFSKKGVLWMGRSVTDAWPLWDRTARLFTFNPSSARDQPHW